MLTSPKHHFTDPSLAVAALRASPQSLLADPEALGLLFESLVIRDLRIYAQAAGAEVYAFADEADAVVDGRVGVLEGHSKKRGKLSAANAVDWMRPRNAILWSFCVVGAGHLVW